MSPGDLVWFDAFYHRSNPSALHPSDYSLKGIIIKKYSREERIEALGKENAAKLDEDLFDIMIEGKIYLSPAGTLISIYREEEVI